MSKVVPKEFWPLVDQPVIQHIINEAKFSGINEIIFVAKPKEKMMPEYLKPSPEIEKVLKERKKINVLEEFKKLENLLSGIAFTFVTQKKLMGDGHAILQAAKLVGDEPVACLFADDIVDAEVPCVAQLAKTYKTCGKPIVALYKLPREKLHLYGIVAVEKIANRLFKIKEIVEKPEGGEAPSDLAIVGKYILTPEVFAYLKKAKPGPRGEILLAETLDKMLKEEKVIYGYEFEGRWLECGNKLDWLKSNMYLGLKHPQFGPELKKFLKEV